MFNKLRVRMIAKRAILAEARWKDEGGNENSEK
jgi:hypothetical protein